MRSALTTVLGLALIPLSRATNVELPPCLEDFKPFVSSGCFQKGYDPALIFRSGLDQHNMTVEKCTAVCKGNGFRYAGLEYYGVCFCGSTINGLQAPDSQCSLPCSGNRSETCGGHKAISVWQDPTFPKSPVVDDYKPLGCFTDESAKGRALSWPVNVDGSTFTTKKCLAACHQGGFPFAGTEYGGECWCGVALAKDTAKVHESECSMPCRGDASDKCGGRARLSLYVAHGLRSLEPCGRRPVTTSSSQAVITTVTKPPYKFPNATIPVITKPRETTSTLEEPGNTTSRPGSVATSGEKATTSSSNAGEPAWSTSSAGTTATASSNSEVTTSATKSGETATSSDYKGTTSATKSGETATTSSSSEGTTSATKSGENATTSSSSKGKTSTTKSGETATTSSDYKGTTSATKSGETATTSSSSEGTTSTTKSGETVTTSSSSKVTTSATKSGETVTTSSSSKVTTSATKSGETSSVTSVNSSKTTPSSSHPGESASTTEAPITTTMEEATSTTASLCTATSSVPSQCEWQRGGWCAPPLPDWHSRSGCVTAAKTCALQVVSCFKYAGQPHTIDCFDFQRWCRNVQRYCDDSCSGRGRCGKGDCWSKYKPGGGGPPATTTSVFPCLPGSATEKPTSIPPATSCPPAPSNICRQPSSYRWGYGPGKPVGGIPLPIVGCNDVKDDWRSRPYKLYTEPDSVRSPSFRWPERPNVCADSCREQYQHCRNTYVDNCRRLGWKGALNKRRQGEAADTSSDSGYCAAAGNHYSWARPGSDSVNCWGWGGNTADKAEQRCRAQYNDCLAVNSRIDPGHQCKTWCSDEQ